MTRRKKQTTRDKTARRQRGQNLSLAGGAALFVSLIALVVYVNIRNQRPVGDEQALPTLGNAHIQTGGVSPIAYNSAPPTSGPHYGGMAPWGVRQQPQRYEEVLHNLEDGGVAVYYQCAEECPELERQLEELLDPYTRAQRRVLLLPNDPTWRVGNSQPLHQDMGNRIALTAWQRIDKFDEFDAERIRAFVERYEGVDHHQ